LATDNKFSYGWKDQMPALVEAGFHVIVTDQRGYNLSDKPKGISAYDVPNPRSGDSTGCLSITHLPAFSSAFLISIKSHVLVNSAYVLHQFVVKVGI
jgi:pimeloyl-ACP methyl ester carboxylesterase